MFKHRRMASLGGVLLAGLAVMIFGVGSVWSCGTIDMFADAYFGRGPWGGTMTKLDDIFMMGDCAHSYKGEQSDARILEVLAHAAQNYGELVRVPPRHTGFKLPYKVMFDVFAKYYCLPGGIDHKNYTLVKDFFFRWGLEQEWKQQCGAERLGHYYRVTAKNGVSARKKPDLKSAKRGNLLSGQIVKVTGQQAGWKKVETDQVRGYVQQDFLKKIRIPIQD